MGRRNTTVKVTESLRVSNGLDVLLGAPALADTDRFVTDAAMANASHTVANAAAPDGLARNVTVKATQAGGSDDTAGSVLITGTNANGDEISEAIVPVNGSTVAGTKLFAEVTSAVQSGWTAGGTADRIEIGFGTKVGLPSQFIKETYDAYYLKPLWGALGTAMTFFGTSTAGQGDDLEECWVDLSASTYDGTKALWVHGAWVAA